LRAEDLADLLVGVVKVCKDNLMKGAAISVIEDGIRIRDLPLLR
jgi:hypothetical protein